MKSITHSPIWGTWKSHISKHYFFGVPGPKSNMPAARGWEGWWFSHTTKQFSCPNRVTWLQHFRVTWLQHYPETAQNPWAKGSIPLDCPHPTFRCQQQTQATIGISGVPTIPVVCQVTSVMFPLFLTLRTTARQVPLSVGFCRQPYWNGLPCPPPGDLPDPGIKPLSLRSPALAGKFFITSTTWEAPSLALNTSCKSKLVPVPLANCLQ